MTTYLIIGCGYLGRHICQFLNHDDANVYFIKRSPASAKDHGNIIQKDWFKYTPNDLPQVDYVFYTMSPHSSRISDYQQAYVDGVKHMISLLSHQRDLKKVVLASSTSVYDVHDGSWVAESCQKFGEHEKTQAILAGESLLTHSDLPWVIARLGGIYGHGRHYLLDLIRQGKCYLNHEQVFSNRIHVHDAARCLHHLSLLPLTEGQLFHGVDPQPTALNTITAWLSSKLGAHISHPMNQEEATRSRLSNKQVSSEKLVATGFNFQYPSFREGFIQIMKQEGMID